MDEKWQIIGNGLPAGTRIYAPDGKDVSNTIAGFKVTQQGSGPPTLSIEIAFGKFEMNVLGNWVKGDKAA